MPSKIEKFPDGGGRITHYGAPRLSKRRNHAPKCFYCDKQSTHQCDAPEGSGTCSRYLCPEHRNYVAADLDFCPPHMQKHREALKRSREA